MKTIFRSLLFVVCWTFCSPFSQAQTPLPGVTNHGSPPVMFVFKNDMIVDQANNIWICTAPIASSPSYLAKWNSGTWEVFSNTNSPLPGDTIYDLFSFENALYIGTSRGLAIYYSTSNTWNLINNANGTSLNHVYSIFADSEALYLGTNNGLFINKNNSWIHYTINNSSISNDTVQAITKALSGKLWLGTRNGLCSVNGATWSVYNSENSNLSGNNIYKLLIDNDNHLWIGIAYPGSLSKMVGETFYSFNDLFPVPIYQTGAFTLSSDNEIIAGLHLPSNRFALAIIKNDDILLYKTSLPPSKVLTYNGLIWYVFNSPSVTNRSLFSFDPALGLMYDGINNISTNKINTVFTSCGRLAWDINFHEFPQFEVPKGSGKNTIFTDAMWIAGISNPDNLHVAAERYGQIGKDFSSGPICASPEIYQSEQHKWNKVWKIKKSEIDYHRANLWSPGYEIPSSIKDWPAHGDTLLGQAYYIAPYMDLNSNGVYEPHLGDYPVIRGDEALFFVFNDHRSPHTESGGQTLGVEVRGLAYAFNDPSNPDLDNTLFVNYQIYNHSATIYDSVYIGFFTDFDLGYYFDDFIGCDTILNAYFAYNADPIDGTGEPFAYGEHPPVQMVVFLNKPLSSFIYFNNTTAGVQPYQTDPSVAIDYYNYMRSIWKDGSPLIFGGNGHPYAGGTGGRVFHMFPGNPNNPSEWHEISVNNMPNDRRGLGSTFIGRFEPGQRICIDKAFVFARDMEGDNLSSLDRAKERITQSTSFFNTNYDPEGLDLKPTGLPEIRQAYYQGLKCYPNPFTSHFIVEYPLKSDHATYYVYNALGDLITSSTINSNLTRISMNFLKPGLYFILVRDRDQLLHQKIVKQ